MNYHYPEGITGIPLASLPTIRECICGAVIWDTSGVKQNMDGKAHRCKRRQASQERASAPVPPKPVADTTFEKHSNEKGLL